MIDLGKYKHISFDLDGTLVHTIPEYRYKVVPQVIEMCGGATDVSQRHIDCFWFEAGRDEIVKDHFQLELDQFWPAFRKIDTAEYRAAHTFAYDDSVRSMQRLKELGKQVSIITGAPTFIAELEIKKLEDVSYDHYTCLRDDGPYAKKPDPRGMEFVLGKLGARPQETLYIGNSNEDAGFAKNAGCDFLYLERKEHEFENTDWMIGVVHSLDELFT